MIVNTNCELPYMLYHQIVKNSVWLIWLVTKMKNSLWFWLTFNFCSSICMSWMSLYVPILVICCKFFFFSFSFKDAVFHISGESTSHVSFWCSVFLSFFLLPSHFLCDVFPFDDLLCFPSNAFPCDDLFFPCDDLFYLLFFLLPPHFLCDVFLLMTCYVFILMFFFVMTCFSLWCFSLWWSVSLSFFLLPAHYPPDVFPCDDLLCFPSYAIISDLLFDGLLAVH